MAERTLAEILRMDPDVLEARLCAVVADAPPLTDEQIELLRALRAPSVSALRKSA